MFEYILSKIFTVESPAPHVIKAPGLTRIITPQGKKWEVDPVAQGREVPQLLDLVNLQVSYAQSLVQPDDEENRRFFEVFHSELFNNFTGILRVLREDNPDAFSRYEELVQNQIRANLAQGENIPYYERRDAYTWPLSGPMIMGSTSTIHDECTEYAGRIILLLPIVQQALQVD